MVEHANYMSMQPNYLSRWTVPYMLTQGSCILYTLRYGIRVARIVPVTNYPFDTQNDAVHVVRHRGGDEDEEVEEDRHGRAALAAPAGLQLRHVLLARVVQRRR